MAEEIILVDDLDEAIEQYERAGYLLDMIKPADEPREAVLSVPPAVAGGLTQASERHVVTLKSSKAHVHPPATAGGTDWIRGRAGMEYRDLIPNRLDGKVIASHIRLTQGGEVPDYIHYHKIDFQIIYCLKGRIKVVYEDQGSPFWLEPGDCVLQPPEIRHRVLECEAGSEVIEITSPAEHETWVEHDLTLPTSDRRPARLFGGQIFHRHIAEGAVWNKRERGGIEECDLGVGKASRGLIQARTLRSIGDRMLAPGFDELILPIDDREVLCIRWQTAA